MQPIFRINGVDITLRFEQMERLKTNRNTQPTVVDKALDCAVAFCFERVTKYVVKNEKHELKLRWSKCN